MKPSAFLFDLDGTLVDTETVWAKAMVDLVASRGGSAALDEILPMVVGRNWLDIHKALKARFPALGDRSADEDAAALRGFYEAHAGDPASMRIEGSIEFLRRASRIAPCAIVSGSPREDVLAAARMCGVEDCLSLVLGAGEYEAGKPSPSGYLRAAALLGVAPERCVVVEDSEVGVASGVAAGMRVIALDRGLCPVPQRYEGEEWHVCDLSELDVEREFSA